MPRRTRSPSSPTRGVLSVHRRQSAGPDVRCPSRRAVDRRRPGVLCSPAHSRPAHPAPPPACPTPGRTRRCTLHGPTPARALLRHGPANAPKTRPHSPTHPHRDPLAARIRPDRSPRTGLAPANTPRSRPPHPTASSPHGSYPAPAHAPETGPTRRCTFTGPPPRPLTARTRPGGPPHRPRPPHPRSRPPARRLRPHHRTRTPTPAHTPHGTPPPPQRITCGKKRAYSSVIRPEDSRMPRPAGSFSTTQAPRTTWLPSKSGRGASSW